MFLDSFETSSSSSFNVSDPSSRGSVRAKKIVNTRDLCLWRNYLVFACCIAPSPNPFGGRESPGCEEIFALKNTFGLGLFVLLGLRWK